MHDIVHNGGGDGRSHYMLQWLDSYASGPTASDRCHPGGEDFADRLYQYCLHALQDFYRQERDQRSSSSHSIVLRECLGRFYLWGEPFGAGDLDEALRQSEELRDNVLERLGHIGKLLLRALSNPPSQPLHQLSKHIKELESFVKQSNPITHGDQDEILQNDRETDEENVSETDLSDSGSYDITEDIDFTVRCLTELGPSLAQNLQHAENARDQHLCLTGVPFSVSGPAKIYVSLVREKFKKAPYRLVERLGEANWQRHMDIREKRESTEKFTSKTGIACSVFRPYSDFHDSGIGTSVPAQTDYAPSHTSFQSSNIEGDQMSLRVPREPAEVSAGKNFECFLCRRIISNVRNRVDWKMHVFADLRPYICTFSDCKDELAQFTTRAAWADHEFTEHRNDQTWNCPECSAKLADASSWEQHLHEIHRRVFTGPQLHVARNAALKTHPKPIETEECPLCRIVLGKQRRAFVKHIGRHMEEIALMVLPRDTEEDSDDSSASTDQTSQRLGNHEVLAAKTGSETSEETSPYQTDSKATWSGRCHSCNRGETSKWRRGPDGARTLCNACGLHYAKLTRKMGPVNRQGQTDQKIEAATTLLHSFEENVTSCICGNQLYPGPPALPGNSVHAAAKGNNSAASLQDDFFIQCDSCKVWQHGGCVGIAAEAMSPEHYFCEQCRRDLHKIRTTVDGRQCSLYIPVQELQNPVPLQVAHLVNRLPAEPPSFQYRRDSSGNLYQVSYVPPEIPVPPPQPPLRSPPMREHGHGPHGPPEAAENPFAVPKISQSAIGSSVPTPEIEFHADDGNPSSCFPLERSNTLVSEDVDTYEDNRNPDMGFVNPPKTISPRAALLHYDEFEERAIVSLDENNVTAGKHEQADFDELPHPSLTQTRHPVYGNSVFSEGQGIYRTNRANDDNTEVQHQPPIPPPPERHFIPPDRGGSPVIIPIQPPIHYSFSMQGEEDQEDIPGTTVSVPSISSRPQNSALAPGDEVEDYIIKCICGSREDDGNTMYCNLCHTWQHTECYYIDKHGNLPTKEELEVIDHFCVNCRPRSVNAKGVIERQRTRREDLDRNSTTTATVEEQKKAGTSSYWSVAEQRDCYNYIRYFGTNWEAISTKLTTKTPQMVKNFYNRKITYGEFGKQLEEDVARADGRRAEGVNMELLPPGQHQEIIYADPTMESPHLPHGYLRGLPPLTEDPRLRAYGTIQRPRQEIGGPPPLPPPRYIDDITAGSDPGWAWGYDPKGGGFRKARESAMPLPKRLGPIREER